MGDGLLISEGKAAAAFSREIKSINLSSLFLHAKYSFNTKNMEYNDETIQMHIVVTH
jgi:hypothetical protein